MEFVVERNNSPINFTYPDRRLLHALFATFLLKYTRELEKSGAITISSGKESIEKVDAILDIYCDKFIEILDKERPWNW